MQRIVEARGYWLAPYAITKARYNYLGGENYSFVVLKFCKTLKEAEREAQKIPDAGMIIKVVKHMEAV